MPRKKKEVKEMGRGAKNMPAEVFVVEEEVLVVTEKKEEGLFAKLSRWFALAAVFFLPFLFVPGLSAVNPIIQQTGIGILSFLSLLCFVVDTFQRATTRRIMHWVVGSLLTVFVLGTLISLYVSPAHSLSFWGGSGVEAVSVISLLIGLVFFFLGTTLFRTANEISQLLKTVYTSLIFTFLLSVGVRSVTSLFGFKELVGYGGFLPFLGSSSELSIFFGLSVILLISGEVLLGDAFIRGSSKRFLLGVLAFVGLVMTGSSAIFIATSIILLISLLFARSTEEEQSRFSQSLLPLCAIVLLVVLGFLGYRPGDSLRFPVEVVPNISTSFSVASQTASLNVRNLLIGSGPNTYAYDYLQFKPLSINLTSFWNTDFQAAYSFWLTLLPTTGLIVSLALLFALVVVLFKGFRLSSTDLVQKNTSRLVGLVALYLLFSSFLYALSFTLICYLFLFFGLLSGLERLTRMTVQEEVVVARRSFVASLGFIGISVLVLVLVIPLGQRAYASIRTNQMIDAYNQEGDSSGMIESLTGVHASFPQENTARILSMLWQKRMSDVLNSQNPKTEELQQLFNDALYSADEATRLNPMNHENWSIKGDVYRNAIPAPGAIDQAVAAYSQARKVNPTSPLYPLLLGQLEFLQAEKASTTNRLGLLSVVEKDLKMVLVLKPNFIEGYIALGQFYEVQNNLEDATLIFEQALLINPSNDIRYLLASIYKKAGRIDEAKTQLQEILKTNPDNQDLLSEIKKLNSKSKINIEE